VTGRNVDALAADIAAEYAAVRPANTESLRKLRREYSKRLRAAEPQDIVALALALQRQPGVHRFLGDELILHHPTAPSTLTRADLEALGRGMNSWDQVDCFAPYLAGPAWRNGQIGEEVIAEWARSPDRWWRRAALVSTVALNVKARGGSGDAPRTLAVCEMLVADRDEMVVKAMSWALRALSPHDPQAVRTFVAEHRSELSPRVVREVGNKLRTGLKNPRAVVRSVDPRAGRLSESHSPAGVDSGSGTFHQKEHDLTYVIGLTGGIGTGKTVVSEILQELGAELLNADLVGHEAYQAGGPAYDDIVTEFGKEVVAADGSIDRKKLGPIAFADPAKLARLNAITHPRMKEMMREKLEEMRRKRAEFVVLEAALLFDAGWEDLADEVWVTVVDPQTAAERTAARSGIPVDQVLERIQKAQMQSDERIRRSDVIIDTSGTMEDTRRRTLEAWAALQQRLE
jgi:dephospho-CoA kinase